MKTIKTYRSNTTKGGALRELAVDAVANGARVLFDNRCSYYYIEDDLISPVEFEKVRKVVHTNVYDFEVLPNGNVPAHYFAVSDLSVDMPTSFPNSTATDEDGNVTPVTWQDVQDSPNVNITQNDDGNYYFPVTANAGFRPLTVDEFDAITEAIIQAKDIPANAESLPEGQ